MPDQLQPSPVAGKSSRALTSGFVVEAVPAFLPDHSNPDTDQFVFGYRISITNEDGRTAQLISRRWSIVDADGREHVVEGNGVVGKQPALAPGQSFTYESFCPLGTAWGTMEGSFLMRTPGGSEFRIRVARFYLVAPEPSPAGASTP